MARIKQTRAEYEAACRIANMAALQRVKDAIDLDPCRKWEVADLARIATMSRFYFQHQFKARYGMPVRQYAMRSRIELACNLVEGGLPILDVTYGAGYLSAGTFTTTFKRLIGCPPTQYRIWAASASDLGRP